MAQLKIFQDEIKQQHTSHWDLDYMTSAQIEAALEDGKRNSAHGNVGHSKIEDSEAPSWWTRLTSRLTRAVKLQQ